jgi:hypothetical protein
MDMGIPNTSMIMAAINVYIRPSLLVVIAFLIPAVFIVNASVSSRWTEKGIRLPPTS